MHAFQFLNNPEGIIINSNQVTFSKAHADQILQAIIAYKAENKELAEKLLAVTEPDSKAASERLEYLEVKIASLKKQSEKDTARNFHLETENIEFRRKITELDLPPIIGVRAREMQTKIDDLLTVNKDLVRNNKKLSAQVNQMEAVIQDQHIRLEALTESFTKITNNLGASRSMKAPRKEDPADFLSTVDMRSLFSIDDLANAGALVFDEGIPPLQTIDRKEGRVPKKKKEKKIETEESFDSEWLHSDDNPHISISVKPVPD